MLDSFHFQQGAKAREEARLEAEGEIQRLKGRIEQIQAKNTTEVSDELKRLDRLIKEKEEAIERLEQASRRMDKNLAEKKKLSAKMESFDFEVGEAVREAEEIIRNMALFLVTLEAIDIEEVQLPEKAENILRILGQKSTRLSQVIDAMFCPKLHIVEQDQSKC